MLFEADEAHRPDREAFLVAPGMSPLPGIPITHPRLPDDFRCAQQDIDELEALGYVRVTPMGTSGFTFDLTEAGIEHARRVRSSLAPKRDGESTTPNPFEWETRVLPVLQAVARASAEADPEIGVSVAMVNTELGRGPDDISTAIVLAELERAGYLEETLGADQVTGPAWCRLREKGLQVTAGWPSASGEVAFARLLAIVDERIADAADDEERSKWESFRDGVLGVGRDVVVGVMTTATNAAAKGLLT